MPLMLFEYGHKSVCHLPDAGIIACIRRVFEELDLAACLQLSLDYEGEPFEIVPRWVAGFTECAEAALAG